MATRHASVLLALATLLLALPVSAAPGHARLLGASSDTILPPSWRPAKTPPAPKPEPADAHATTAAASTIRPTGAIETIELGVGVTLDLVWIAGGQFTMGSTLSAAELARKFDLLESGFLDESPAHGVTLDGFWIGRTEVTVAQFRRFTEAASHRTDAERLGQAFKPTEDGLWEAQQGLTWRDPGFPQDDAHPVVCVSWNDATAFCNWLWRRTGRDVSLPTEAQWEYACRGGAATLWPWGDDVKGGAGWLNAADQTLKRRQPKWKTFEWDDGCAYTAPVGTFKANQYGLVDMHGNVMEWCRDFSATGYYAISPALNPRGPNTGVHRILRGGAWSSNPAVTRSASRGAALPTFATTYTGFRICRAAAPGER